MYYKHSFVVNLIVSVFICLKILFLRLLKYFNKYDLCKTLSKTFSRTMMV